MSRAKSGRIASFHLALGALQQGGWQALTYDAANKAASYGTEGEDFWYHSDKYPVELRMNGVVSVPQNWATPSTSTNQVKVKSFTYQINGVRYTASTQSVSGLTISTGGAGTVAVHTVIATASGLYAVATTSGAQTSTRGVAGGPSYVPVDGIALFYVIRATSGASIIDQTEITMTEFDGTEWACPKLLEIRPLLRKVRFDSLPAAVHAGDTYPAIYARAYTMGNCFAKSGQAMDWKYAMVENRETATTQNAGREESDKGRPGYTFSANKYVSTSPDEIFTHQNADDAPDVFVKMFHDKADSSKYQIAQMGLGIDFDLPMADKQKGAVTGEITGYIEEIG